MGQWWWAASARVARRYAGEMDALRYSETPDGLRDPVLVLAFFGWNDAADAATDAVKYLRNLAQTPAFASIDPDEFFVFTEHRPTVKWIDGDDARREVVWPVTDFTVLRLPSAERDLILGLGTEPDLRWRAYCRLILDVARTVEVGEVLTLGALLADVAHTRPTSISGGSSSLARSRQLGFEPSRYEGPTGIVGSVGEACRQAGLDHMGLWASVPHYVTSRHNPGATKAILEQLGRIYGIDFDLSHLERAMQRYRREVDDALEDKPDVRDYVRSLEERNDRERGGMQPDEPQLESREVLDEIDRLLRGDA